MADKARNLTDKKLEQMEKHLSAIYRRAEKEIGESWKQYLEEIGKEIEDLQKKYDIVKKSGDQKEIKKLGIELSKAKKEKTLLNKHYKNLTNQIAEDLLKINQTAVAYINDNLPEIYSLNYNALANATENINGYSFELVDASTVKNLATSDKTLLPYKIVDGKKDVRWNTKKVNAEVLQGIIQGESMQKIANRLQNVTEMNRTSAIRNARTTVTSAENKGRFDSYQKAESDGLILEKFWLAFYDKRARTWHKEAGKDYSEDKSIPVSEPFIVDGEKMMFPGDNEHGAHGHNLYNCRCAMGTVVVGFKNAQGQKAMAQQAEPPATTEDAIKTAHDLGVKYAQFEKMPLEQVNNAIDAVRTLPKDCVPKVIASGKDVSTVTGRPLGRKADQWWGVTYDYRDFSLRTMQLGYDATDHDGGLIVGLNTQKFKTLDALTKAKKATNDAYFAKTGRYWSFNTDGKATAYHEIGHCFADVRGLPKGWEDASARWAEESACDLLKKPDEAFAEAWAAYHLGDKRLPDYISTIIGGLK